MKDRIGVGVLSFAHGHAGVYCQVMKDFEDVTLVSAWDDNPVRGQANCDSYGMAFCADPAQVLEDPRVDAVIVSCETNRHADFVVQAAAAGKDILLQKPMATTLEDCDRIIKAVKESGVKFSMAYQMRQDPVNQKIKELLDAGAVGKVSVVRRRHAINVLLSPDFVNGPTRWHFDPQANIGMFFDDATHAADWFYWLLGRPHSVIAEIDRVVTDVPTDDTGLAVYRFGKGEMGILLNSSVTLAAVSTTEIYGDEGTIVQDYGDMPATSAPRPADAVPLRMIRKGDKAWTEYKLPIPANQGERIRAVPRPFVDYARGLTDQTVSAEEGRVVIEMVLGALKSSEEGRRVML